MQSSESAGKNRRRAPRVSFGMTAMMAACEGKEIPPEADFSPIETRDLSPVGISFFAEKEPPSKSLVLLLSSPDTPPVYVTASVVHCNEGFWERRRRFLVGCELTGRLYPPSPSDLETPT